MNDLERIQDMNKDILLRKEDLLESIKFILKGKSVTVDGSDKDVILNFEETAAVRISVENEGYKIYGVSMEWVAKTTYLCEKNEDDVWFYWLETIDECVGELKRLVTFETKKEKENYANISYEKQLKLSGMDNLNNWKGDPRERLITLFEPLISDSGFEFIVNMTDSSSKILELYRKGKKKRIMGIAAKAREEEIGVFFNAVFYEEINRVIDLPENQRKNKTQPHMKLPLYIVWNIICVATGNMQSVVQCK